MSDPHHVARAARPCLCRLKEENAGETPTPRFLRQSLRALALMLAMLAGCWKNYGAGGTGEMVVPYQQLRDIEASDFSPYASTQPATTQLAAATNPTSQPSAPEMTLTISQVREQALSNNLDIHVELLNPTIAREQLTEQEAQFESLFTTNINYAVLDQPTSSTLQGS